MHSLEQTWVLKQGRYFTTCVLSKMRLLLQEVPLDGGSPAAQGYRGRWWCPWGAPPSPRLCLPAPHHQSYENESPEPPLGQQHSWPLPCLSLSRLPLSQGSSGNEYAAVNCRGALRCSAARTCDGCETRMSLFFFFASCRSQVSLLPRLLIPKRREPKVQSQPTENLQVSAPRCWPGAQHSPTQSHLPGKASEQASKPTRAFKGLLTRRRGEPCTVLLCFSSLLHF